MWEGGGNAVWEGEVMQCRRGEVMQCGRGEVVQCGRGEVVQCGILSTGLDNTHLKKCMPSQQQQKTSFQIRVFCLGLLRISLEFSS